MISTIIGLLVIALVIRIIFIIFRDKDENF